MCVCVCVGRGSDNPFRPVSFEKESRKRFEFDDAGLPLPGNRQQLNYCVPSDHVCSAALPGSGL